jgi:mRNA interferase RelE/StbE
MRKLQLQDRRRVQAILQILADEPRPPAAKKLVDSVEWRVRVGDYRIIYRIDDGALVVLVVDVAHRREVYRGR